MRQAALAIAAHPDDIEFMMAGTLILLKRTGWAIHCMNIADGCCGSTVMSRAATARRRWTEARAAARLIGAIHHPSIAHDIEVFYDKPTLARVAAVVRKVDPRILLVPAPEDYMEDHVIAARLAVTAAFCRGMRNFPTVPPTPPVAGDCTVYHALPHGLRDQMDRPVRAGLYVNVGGVLDLKRRMLACHGSQKEWLDRSQGMDAYLDAMEQVARRVGLMSRRFRYAEGWRRHNPIGFCGPHDDPLRRALGRLAAADRTYRRRAGRRF